MYTAIVNHPKLEKFDLTSIKVCLSGGAPLPGEIRRRFETLSGCKLVEGYGLTETSPLATANPIGGLNKEARSACRCPAPRSPSSTRRTPRSCFRRARTGRSAFPARR